MTKCCFAIVELPKPITLSDSALGKQFMANMEGYKFKIETPTLNKASNTARDAERFGSYLRNLGHPKSANKFLKNPQETDWGNLIQTDKKGNSIALVRHLFVIFPNITEDLEKFSESIYLSNSKWFERLDDFVRLISDQRTMGITRVTGYINPRCILYKANPSAHLPFPHQQLKVSIFHTRPCDCADYDQLSKAVKLCSKNKIVPLQFNLLLKAYDAHGDHDSRSVVIEASTALEVAATQRIRAILAKDRVPEKHVDLMLKGHQTLTNRMKLLKKLGMKIPVSDAALENEVIKIRNKTVHGGYPVEVKEADKLLFHAQTIIWDITPDFAVLAV